MKAVAGKAQTGSPEEIRPGTNLCLRRCNQQHSSSTPSPLQAEPTSPPPQAEPKTCHLTHEDPETLQPHPVRVCRTFISRCLNQPVKPIHASTSILQGAGLAARRCRAPLPEQHGQIPLCAGSSSLAVRRGVTFPPKKPLPLLITRLLNVTPVHGKGPAGFTGSRGSAELETRVHPSQECKHLESGKTIRVWFLFLALPPSSGGGGCALQTETQKSHPMTTHVEL